MELFKILGKLVVDTADGIKQLTNASSAAKQTANDIEDAGSSGEKTGGKMSSAFKKIGSGAVKVAKVVGAGMVAAGGAVAGLVTKSVQGYADFEQLVGGVETLFKGSANTVLKNANQAYKTAGLSANAYMETVTSFSASLLQSLGGDTAAAAEKADMAIVDMSDNANKMGTSMEMIQNAYQGFAKQNYTMLDNLKLGYGGTKEEMGRLLADAQAISGIEYDISSYADVVDAIHVIQNEMGITGTTAKEASSTISGSIASMKSAWSNLMVAMSDENADFGSYVNNFVDSVTTVADNLMPRISVALDGVASLIDKLAPVIIGKVPELLKQVLPNLISAATNIINELASILPSVISTLVSMIPQVVRGFSSIFTSLIEALPALVQSLVDALPTLIRTIANALEDLFVSICAMLPQIIQPIIDALPELILLIAGSLIDSLPALIEGFISLFNGLVQALPQIIQGLVEALPVLIDMIVTALTDNLPIIIEGVIQLVMGIVNALPQIITTLVDAIPNIITMLVDAIKTNLPVLIEGAIQLMMGLVDALPQIIQALVDATPIIMTAIIDAFIALAPDLIQGAIQLVMALVQALPQIFASLIQGVVGIFSGIWESVKNVFGGIGDWFGEKFSAAKEKASEAWANAKEKFANTWDNIKGAFANVGGWFKEQFAKGQENAKNAWANAKSNFTKIKDGITNVFTNVGNWFKDKFTDAKEKAQNAWANAKSNFTKVKDGIASAFSNVKEKLAGPFEKARDTVKGVADKIKGFFKGEISFPKIKMPHFGIKPEGWKIGDLLQGSIPRLSIDWYAEAMKNPMIMTKPTIFGYDAANGKLMGGGEAGSEVVSGTGTLMSMIRGAVAEQNSGIAYYLQKIIELLAQFFPEMLEALDISFAVDGKELATALASPMNTALGKIAVQKGRGR